jgi:resuscitation-promoting factor RpfB
MLNSEATNHLCYNPDVKATHLRVLFASAVIIAIGIVIYAARKTITLEIDGQTREMKTFTWTVSQLLKEASIDITPEDRIQPTLEHWLKNGERIQLVHAAWVIVQADGKTVRLLSPESDPISLLAQARVKMLPGDQLVADGKLIPPMSDSKGIALPYSSEHSLLIRRANSISLTEKGPEGIKTTLIASTAPSLGQALWEAGYRLSRSDRLIPSPETPLQTADSQDPLQASLIYSRELSIQTGREIRLVRSAAATIGEALADVGLPLQGLDYSQPGEGEALPADGRIRIVRVREEVIVEQTPTPFKTEFQPDKDLELDHQRTMKAGEFGLLARRVRVRFENGKEVSRSQEGEWVAQAPQNRIIGFGTKVVMHTLDTPNGAIRYWRALRFWATAYSPTTAGGEITASGKKLRKGLVAVDRHLIPFGTLMYIPGYGNAEAADTGAFSGRWIDLGFRNEDFVGWHQWVTVYFLWPPPANILWQFP